MLHERAGSPHARFPDPYQYASLASKPRIIRLLKICDKRDCDSKDGNHIERNEHERPFGQDIDSKTPRLKLYEHKLDTAPAYEAISYAWGSTASMQQIVCNSGALQVTQSCFRLLCTLRERDLRKDPEKSGLAHTGVYWIDAICIDQSSPEERSQQVAIMASIYEKADRVVVWPEYIGDGEGFIKEVLLCGFSGRMREMDALGLRGLIERPYFTRVWPLQEIALARSCCILMGTRTELDIRAVLLMPHEERVISKPSTPLGPIAVAVRTQYEQVTSLHRQLLKLSQQRSGSSPSVSIVLLGARSLQATEPRDKVFALHGLLQRWNASLESPDYTKSIREIYVNTAAAAISIEGSLRILGGLTGSSNLNLPSWCPDWSDHQHITEVAEWQNHKATGQSKPQFGIKKPELSITGSVVDLVCEEHFTFPPTSILYEGNNLTETLSDHFDSPSSIPTHCYEILFYNFSLAIWKNVDIQVLDTEVNYLNFVRRDFERKIESENFVGRARSAFYNMITSERRNPGLKKLPHKGWPHLHAGLCRRLDRKKLFQTQHGRLGIASSEIKVGDSILLLQGCNLPMVARADGENWRLIAPAYIQQDGMMDGKLWETARLRQFIFI